MCVTPHHNVRNINHWQSVEVGEICRKRVFLIGRNSSTFSSRHWHPRQLPVCPVSRVHRRCDVSVATGQDDSSLNETLTSQRATRRRLAGQQGCIFLGKGVGEEERLLETVQPYSRVCGRMTRGAGRGLGGRHRRAGGWNRGVWRKPWNKLPPCPLRLIPPSHPSGHSLAPDPRFSPNFLFP